MRITSGVRVRRSAVGWLLALLLLVATVACGGSDSGDGGGTTAARAGAGQIVMSGNKFQVPVTVAPGATVTLVNKDKVEHSVTSTQAGLFDVEVEGGESKTFTVPANAGSYSIYCRYHSGMTGTLVVG
ncbi:cupredoxin domain-containing protein [Nocardia inohanensis]|uniref:cupredoxin domain-containing protein n=1 Tax=Nocardia inohanensis TaxID=209246 RepID=UPI000A066BD8|nr:cupredoxin domain-containing protein [Nocardia inohanensis]